MTKRLFAFYDRRIGSEVVSRSILTAGGTGQQGQSDLLSFDKQMLIKEGAEKVSQLDYPNFWHQGNLKLN